MATNKHATIRYHALDRCFNNYGRKFFIEDLINTCNDAIYDFAGITDGVKRRQIFDDITFMESEQGWSIPLERLKEGKRVYYRYADKSFSIKNQGINQSEALQVRETLSILSRFKGLPQFEWIEEMQIRIEDTFKLKGVLQTVVGFEQNPYLKGLQHFTPLFDAIQNQQALSILYQSFRQQLPSEFVFHPWYLKQYNNRWFLFGWNDQVNSASNLAIDRIISMSDTNIRYKLNLDIDFDEYFDDIIGVTIHSGTPITKILLEIESGLWPYILSKPIHGSQKLIKKSVDSVTIELNLIINHELIATLLSFGENIKVTEPKSFRDEMCNRINLMLQKYL